MPRRILLALVLLLPGSVDATQHWKAISIEGCTSIGPDPAMLASTQWAGNLTDNLASVGWTDAVYLCDADLPSTATGFDYADFEYLGGYDVTPPWVVAYVDTEVLGFGGNRYSRVEAIGWCGGEVTAAGPPMPGLIPSMTVCQTSGSLSWAANPPGSSVQRVSVFFLVFAPTWDGSDTGTPSGPIWWMPEPMNWVYRIIVHYQQ